MSSLLRRLLSVALVVAFVSPVLAEDKKPAAAKPALDDVRFQPLKDLNGYFPFTVPTDKDAWAKRAEFVKRQVAVSQGVWPLPEKTPLNAVMHSPVERDGYTVWRVFFESVPGHYV